MDSTHIGGDMSPLYVPRKRKTVQSQPRSAPPCPAAQQIPERAGDPSTAEYPESEVFQQHDAMKMKRIHGRKRYEDLQNVSIATVDYATTSCSMMSPGDLSNGSDPGTVAPPPRLAAKDVWPPGPDPVRDQVQVQTHGQGWGSGRGQGPESWGGGHRGHPGHEQTQTWMPGGERGLPGPDRTWMAARGQDPDRDQGCWDGGQEESWAGVRDRDVSGGPDPGWGAGQGQGQTWSSAGEARGNVWRPDLHMKKVQRLEAGGGPAVHNFRPPPESRGSCAASTVQPSEDQKPPVLPTKKEPPTYPPGSQEERWQLQIVAKGRVTCPKCKSVSRKTVEGLKKHMENCRLQPFTCQHCGKQLKSSTGMKYHIMADHSHLPSVDDAKDLDDRALKDKLRKILKRLGKLKCSKEGCSAAFTSIMGYVYHMKKCGKEESELEKMLLSCSHCGKTYRSKAGLEYHLKSEHAPAPQKAEEDEALRARAGADPERTASGRVQRASAQVANFHLAEIANNDLPKDWPKRKFQSDLVPDDKKLKYARPGLPAFSQEVLRKWKNEVKLQRKVHCPNQGCGCTYTSVSGLKAHLGLCTRGEFEAGKYRCLICNKEFNSESGVKYHINSVHSQDWFVTNKKASKKFEKFLKNQPKGVVHYADDQPAAHQYGHPQLQPPHHHLHHPHHLQQPLQPLHHLQPQAHFLHPPQEPVLHYTPLEPPSGPTWVEVEVEAMGGPEQGLIHVDKAEDGEKRHRNA